jgi:SnoaL-like domain
MTDIQDPAAVLTRLLHAIDNLDWVGVRGCLADEIRTDYTELFGGEPVVDTGDALVEQWQGLLAGFDATQHLTGPVLIEAIGDGWRANTHVRAHHRLTNETWSVYGHYVCSLAADRRITDLTLQLHYQDGDTSLPEKATDRARNSPRQPRT